MRFSRHAWLPFLFALAACGQHTSTTAPYAQMKVGKPYIIDGKTYYPEYDPTYDKIGDASWYGPGFHGKYTANGEIFNQNDLTAAHPTLPMPSLVRVTNLENGRSIVVRINDRGPFKSNRIIDLSKKSAERIGITSTTRVRVQYLKKETDEYVANLQNGGAPMDMFTFNDQAERLKDASVIQSTEPVGQTEASVAMLSPAEAGAAAPIMSVSSGDINQRGAGNAPVQAAPIRPILQGGLVRDAMADDNVSSSAAVNEKTVSASPAISETDVEPEEPGKGEVKLSPHVSMMQQGSEPEGSTSYDSPKSAGPAVAPAPAHVQKAGSVSGGHYMIQAGSFSSEENARNLHSRLNGVSNVSVDKVMMGEKTWWRVRAGPFANKEDADEALAKIRAQGATDARLAHP